MGFAPQQETLAVLLDLGGLQADQVADHVFPLQLVALLGKSVVEFLAQDQRQERAENVPPNRLVTFVKDGTCFQEGFRRTKHVLHHPKLLVFQRHIGRRQVGVGAKDPLAVVTGILLDLLFVNLELRLGALEVFALAALANQRFIAPLELFTQGSHDCLSVMGILAGFLLVETNHIAAALDDHLLDFQR